MKALFFDGQRRHRKDLPQPMPRGEEALMRPGRRRIVKSILAAPLPVSPVPLVVEEMVIIGSP